MIRVSSTLILDGYRGALTRCKVVNDSLEIFWRISEDGFVRTLLPRDPVGIEWNFLFPNGDVDHCSLGFDDFTSALDTTQELAWVSGLGGKHSPGWYTSAVKDDVSTHAVCQSERDIVEIFFGWVYDPSGAELLGEILSRCSNFGDNDLAYALGSETKNHG